MAAEVLSQRGFGVEVFDAMPSAGRKFLMAGKGGLNLTHSEPFDAFLSRFGSGSRDLEPILRAFPPQALRAWAKDLGIETFVGSSGRVFPSEMKAAPLLRAWLQRLRGRGVRFHMRHRWLGWRDRQLRFHTPHGDTLCRARAVLLALGGGSWPQLGSDAAWVQALSRHAIDIVPLRPANCGFEVDWSARFRETYAGQPLKPVRLEFSDSSGRNHALQGELTVSAYGLEGGLIYAASAQLRDAIAAAGQAEIRLDLLPGRSLSSTLERLQLPRGKESTSNYWRKRLGLSAIKIALLREIAAPAVLNDGDKLAELLKALPVQLRAPRPLAEAISSAGGVKFSEMTGQLMLRKLPGVFCAGEMLDWEAPTGGYLLSACLASGHWAGTAIADWLATAPADCD